MSKPAVEPIRKAALINATIAEIGRVGSLDVTVAQIARSAGMSSALAHHYFGSKDQIFLAAMRKVLRDYGVTVRDHLRSDDPRERLDAIIVASFAQPSFHRDVIGAWLNFFAMALTHPEAARMMRVYQRRLRSNLIHALRPLSDQPQAIASTLGALIDGVYLRAVLTPDPVDPEAAIRILRDYLNKALA